ncbi:MAG: PIN domain-containing protein [Planctomycetota bacterium]|nr:PIN domain-containing protein [Planctomycetota bacterium]
MALWILRISFFLVSVGVGFSMATLDLPDNPKFIAIVIPMVGAISIIVLDLAIPRKRIEVITCVYFGIVIALTLTYFVTIAVKPFLINQDPKYESILQILCGVALSYVCISWLIQTRDDFRFIIPYVEFSKEIKGSQPLILDTSVVIDGRITDLAETGILDTELIMPHFVLMELQTIADSSDKLRRSRGRRGLDVLNRLQEIDRINLKFHDRETPEMDGQPVDMKLVFLAKHMDGKLVTGDFNLNKVASLHDVNVLNLNEIANALKPVFLPGEHLEVKIVKAGESPTQGVGYLEDGTMVVVEGGQNAVNQMLPVIVTSVLQTNAGRMIFSKHDTADAVN